MREHDHVFDFYLAIVDRWACRCGVSMDRERGLWNADGTRVQRTVTVTGAMARYREQVVDALRHDARDPGLRSGRELLSC